MRTQECSNGAATIEHSFRSRRESQLPAAFFALELVFGLCLGCCASAAWTLHRANVSHDVNFSRLPTSPRLGHRFEFLPNWGALRFTCSCDFHLHFWFHDTEEELAK